MWSYEIQKKQMCNMDSVELQTNREQIRAWRAESLRWRNATNISLSELCQMKVSSTQRRADNWVLFLVETYFFSLFGHQYLDRKQNFWFSLNRSAQPTWDRVCDVRQANTGSAFSRILSTLNDTFQRIFLGYFLSRRIDLCASLNKLHKYE